MSHADARARLEALLQRVVSRKDAPRAPRAHASAAPVAAPTPVAAPMPVAAPTPVAAPAPVAAPVAPAPVLRAPTPIATPVAPAPRAADPVLRPATRTAPLVALEPPPAVVRAPEPRAPEPLFEPDPVGPEISEDADESVEIPTSSLDLTMPIPEGELFGLREPEPSAPAPALAPEALLVTPPTPVFVEAPAPLPDVTTPVSHAAPTFAEPTSTQLFEARPLPAAQRARVVAMPAVAPTPLRELVKRSMELRVRRPHRP